MKCRICKHLKDKIVVQMFARSPSINAGLIHQGNPRLKWSTDNIEFDQSILMWHIANDLCYNSDRSKMARSRAST